MVEEEAIGFWIGANNDALEGPRTKFIFVMPPLFSFLLEVGCAEHGEEGAVISFSAVD